MLNKLALEKLEALNNPKVMEYLEDAIALCKPAKVTVITDSPEDIQYVKDMAVKNGEETPLATKGHTYHFDGMRDQARDKAHTAYLLPEEVNWGMNVNSVNKAEGTKEVREYMDGIMEGKEMIVCFFSLGPKGSEFSLKAMQITDSFYVVHSEMILYRSSYEGMKDLNGSDDFFFFLHSAGELEGNVTKNIDKRRIYIDLEENRVYTVNNQYAGNSVGLKKLCFRLAIQKANNEDWLAEHMFLMGVHGKPGRITYFAGAFPSACGKTSTAMISGQTIVGDDIAYLKRVDGNVMSVNVEQGIFGIIRDVNPQDDELIYNAITGEREVIFSNILVKDGKTYWEGMGSEIPKSGLNFSGEWTEGKTDANGNKIDFSHKNSRYTVRINELDNADTKADDPAGVKVEAIVYGGRDSDTTIPVVESLSWEHGVFYGAIIESETTAATLGAQGVRVHNPMANLDFISVPLGKYLDNHMKFQDGVKDMPKIYATNYFLKGEDGKWLNGITDKKVWILWADGRVNGDFDAIDTPVGKMPKYEDLKVLFKDNLGYDFTREDYKAQFSIRIDKYLDKMDRMEKAFAKVDTPAAFDAEFKAQVERLKGAKAKYGSVITPDQF